MGDQGRGSADPASSRGTGGTAADRSGPGDADRPAVPPDAPVDARLVPAACAVWLGAVVLVRLTPRVALVAGLTALVLTAVVLATAVRGARSGARQRGGCGARAGSPVVPARPAATGADATSGNRVQGGGVGAAALALGAVGVLLLAGAAQLGARAASGLGALGGQRASVELLGRVRTVPTPVTGQGPGEAASSVRLLLAVEQVGVRGDATSARAGGAVVELVAPGPDDALVPGARVVVAARLSPARGAGERAVARARASEDVRVRDPPHGVAAVTARLRAGLRAQAAELPGDAGLLLPGVAVGDTTALGDLTDAMRTSGLTHLTAVSGAHFAMVGGVVLAVCGACRVPRRCRPVPTGLVLVGLVALVQPGPSVVRAAVMGAVGLVGVLVGRPARSVPALAAAVVLLLVADPWLATEVGFALSVAATAGIALLAGPLAAPWAGSVGRPAALALAVPVAAQAACGPVVLLLTPAIPLYAVPANLAAAPAVGPATVLGLAATLLDPWWPGAARCCAAVAGAACWWLGAVARTAVRLPGAQLPWVAGPVGVLLLTVATAAAVRLLLRCRRGMAP